jgi:carbon-monoxide dehydrogenase large subunit
VLSDKLGIDADLIRYAWGGSDVVTQGIGTFGSRSAVLAGNSVALAADRVIEGQEDRRASAGGCRARHRVRQESSPSPAPTARWLSGSREEIIQPGIHSQGMDQGRTRAPTTEDTVTFPNGTHICEVEIDEDTGRVELTRYFAVDDVGVMINPLLCEGQIIGGIVQGAGQALMEDVHYDRESGQLLTGSLNDYAMPRADDFPDFDLHSIVVPTKKNQLGVKGAGEAGTCGALPTVMNAVNDALASIGAPRIEMPATQEKVWRAIRAAAQR